MKYIATISVLFIAMLSFGQSNNFSVGNKLLFNKDSISQIEITNYCSPTDSCQRITYKLNQSMTMELIDRLNESDSIGPCEFDNFWWLYISLTNGTVKSYITNGSSMSEPEEDEDSPLYVFCLGVKDSCLKLKDAEFIKNLWNELRTNNYEHRID